MLCIIQSWFFRPWHKKTYEENRVVGWRFTSKALYTTLTQAFCFRLICYWFSIDTFCTEHAFSSPKKQNVGHESTRRCRGMRRTAPQPLYHPLTDRPPLSPNLLQNCWKFKWWRSVGVMKTCWQRRLYLQRSPDWFATWRNARNAGDRRALGRVTHVFLFPTWL